MQVDFMIGLEKVYWVIIGKKKSCKWQVELEQPEIDVMGNRKPWFLNEWGVW